MLCLSIAATLAQYAPIENLPSWEPMPYGYRLMTCEECLNSVDLQGQVINTMNDYDECSLEVSS